MNTAIIDPPNSIIIATIHSIDDQISLSFSCTEFINNILTIGLANADRISLDNNNINSNNSGGKNTNNIPESPKKT